MDEFSACKRVWHFYRLYQGLSCLKKKQMVRSRTKRIGPRVQPDRDLRLKGSPRSSSRRFKISNLVDPGPILLSQLSQSDRLPVSLPMLLSTAVLHRAVTSSLNVQTRSSTHV